MSWKDYQNGLEKEPGRKKWALPVGVILLATFVVSSFWWLRPLGRQVPSVSIPPPPLKEKFREAIDLNAVLGGSSELRMNSAQENWTAHLTIDEDFQRFLTRKLRSHRPDWAGVAVLDAMTGEVLALGSHSEKEPEANDLALRATYPAASIFKMITAAAAVEKRGYQPSTLVRYDGSPLKIRFRDILRDGGQGTMSLGDGFARSANLIFARIGAKSVGRELLVYFGDQFGFNANIPFEATLGTSVSEIPLDDPIEAALAAAGFGDITLSPLHGALLAAAVVNGGVMMEPYLVRQATNAQGVVYEMTPRVWRRPITFTTARELRSMMGRTITFGTAHRAFRRIDRDPVLKYVDIGGKTGSLRGKNPRGRTEWFVGYASNVGRRIAIGIAIVSDKVWRVKPADLAQEIFRYYYSPRPVVAVNP